VFGKGFRLEIEADVRDAAIANRSGHNLDEADISRQMVLHGHGACTAILQPGQEQVTGDC